MDSRRLDELITAYLLDAATPAELAELEQLLRADPDTRREFVAQCLLDAQLHRTSAAAGAAEPSPVAGRITRPMRSPWLGRLAIATGLLLVFGLTLYILLPPAAARLVEGTLAANGTPVTGRVPLDQPLTVTGPSPATVRLADGSQATFDPGSAATLHQNAAGQRYQVDLTAGLGRFDITHAKTGFQVLTPAGTVTVLGTAFTVGLDGPDMTVHVLRGQVRVDAEGRSDTLAAGDTHVYRPAAADTGRTQGRLIAYNALDNTITLTRGGDRSEPRTYKLAPNAAVRVDGAIADRATMPINTFATLSLNRDATVSRIDITGPETRTLTLLRLDTTTDPPTLIFAGGEGRPEITYRLTKGARILTGAQHATLDDLKPGTRLSLLLNTAGTAALEVHLELPRRPETRQSKEPKPPKDTAPAKRGESQ